MKTTNINKMKAGELITLATQLHQFTQIKNGNMKPDTKKMMENLAKADPKKYQDYAKRLVELWVDDAQSFDIKELKTMVAKQKRLIKEQHKIFTLCNRHDIDFEQVMQTENKNAVHQIKSYIVNGERENQLRDLKWQVSKWNDVKFPACVTKVIRERIQNLENQNEWYEMHNDGNGNLVAPFKYGAKGQQEFAVVYVQKNQGSLKLMLEDL